MTSALWLFLVIVFNLWSYSICSAKLSNEHVKPLSVSGFMSSHLFRHSSPQPTSVAESKLPVIRHHRFNTLDKLICQNLGCANTSVNHPTTREQKVLPRKQPTPEPTSFAYNRKDNVRTSWSNPFTNGEDDEDDDEDDDETEDQNQNEDEDNETNDDEELDEYVEIHKFRQNNDPIYYPPKQQSPIPKPTISSLTEKKWRELGTQEKTNERFLKRFGTLPSGRVLPENEKKAKTHASRMQKETCSAPTPIVIRVKDTYKELHKEYYPTCTKLYRCTEQSGCCSESAKCSPHAMETVSLYFTVTTLVQGSTIPKITYETLTFTNHTSCKCQKKEERRVDDSSQNDERVRAVGESTSILTNLPDADQNSKCICPSPFSARIQSEGQCSCDCFDGEKYCIKYKKGLKHFPENWRRCIKERGCTAPTCDYGTYLIKVGRCPVKGT